MRSPLSVIPVFSLSLASIVTAQDVPHSADQFLRRADTAYTITAYWLTTEQEISFAASDSAVSPFWRAWDTVPALSRVMLDTGDRAYGPPDKKISAVTLEAAYGAKGVYALFKITDAEWVGYQNSLDYANDAIDFYVDQYSAESLYTPPGTKFPNLLCYQVTGTSCQLMHRMGVLPDPYPASTFHFGDPLIQVKPGNCDLCFWTDDCLILDPAPRPPEVQWGLVSRPFASVDPATRFFEWLIPWGIWGGPNNGGVNPAPRPEERRRFAMTFGYNDLDGTTNDYTALRWRNRADPWTMAPNPNDSGKVESVDCWGDILCGGALNDQIAAARAPIRPGLTHSLWVVPMRGALSIRCDLSEPGPVDVAIYSPAGRLIDRISSTAKAPGRWSYVWTHRMTSIGGNAHYVVRVRAAGLERCVGAMLLR